MVENPWTEDRVKALRIHCKEGLSASKIADKLGGGITRNAVIGKMIRLGITERRRANGVVGPRPPRPAVKRQQALIARPTFQAPAPKPKSVPLIEPKPFELKPGEKVTIFHLSSTTCRWPIGDPVRPDFHFCGHVPRDGSPYCEFHYQQSLPAKRADA